MKKHLLISFIALSVSSAVVAQPTLTNAGIAPQIGDVFILHAGAYQAPGSSGSNQTWNFSTYSGPSTVSLDMVDPDNTPYGTTYPTSTICSYSFAQGTYQYLQVTSGFLYQVGAEQPGASINFSSNTQASMKYPFTMGNTWTDTYSAQGDVGLPFTRTGTVTATADAYGTLTTPQGTFTNVLRVHFTDAFSDAFAAGTYTGTQDFYQWYKEGTRFPLFHTNQATYNGSPSSNAYYISSPVGIEEYVSAPLEIYPNPAVNELRISDGGTRMKSVEVFNQLGEKLFSLSTSQLMSAGMKKEKTINVSDLSSGVYFVKVISENTTRMAKFVKQ